MENANQPANELDKWRDLERRLQEIEEEIQELKLGISLGYRRDRLEQSSRQIEHSSRELDAIYTEIASYLFNWSSLKVPFWQIVRFSGLGFLLGLALRSCA
jgi:hypothetical protein